MYSMYRQLVKLLGMWFLRYVSRQTNTQIC